MRKSRPAFCVCVKAIDMFLHVLPQVILHILDGPLRSPGRALKRTVIIGDGWRNVESIAAKPAPAYWHHR